MERSQRLPLDPGKETLDLCTRLSSGIKCCDGLCRTGCSRKSRVGHLERCVAFGGHSMLFRYFISNYMANKSFKSCCWVGWKSSSHSCQITNLQVVLHWYVRLLSGFYLAGFSMLLFSLYHDYALMSITNIVLLLLTPPPVFIFSLFQQLSSSISTSHAS